MSVIAETVATAIPRIFNRAGPTHSAGAARHSDNRLLITGLIATDLAALTLASATTAGLRLVLDTFLPVVALGYPERHALASLLVLPVLFVLFSLHGLYDVDNILAGSREYARIGNAVTYGVVIVLICSFFVGLGPLVSRSWLLLLWLTSVTFTGSGRFIARRVVRRLRARGLFRTRVVIVGASELGVAIAAQLRAATNEGVDVVGFLDEYITVGQKLLADVAVIGRPSDVARASFRNMVDEYLLVPQALPHERLAEIIRLMVARNAPTMRMAVSSSDLLTHGLIVAQRASVPLVTMKRARISGVDAVLKRGLDVLGSAAALFILGPLMVGMYVVGACTNRRIVLARQDIRGACGEATSFSLFANDALVSPLLRGVPAFWAVLSGKLSLVGPRPASVGTRLPATLELDLTAVRPGLTGPWRLSGPEASIADQAVRDLAYVREYTIWEDLRIIAESLRSLVGRANRNQLARWQSSTATSTALRM